MNIRRRLVIALGAGALTATFAAFPQQPAKVWRIGVLAPRARPATFENDFLGGPLLRGLRELGYVEGKNIMIEWRFTEAGAAPLQSFADELARLKVDLIVAENTTTTAAAQKATSTIPIVFGTAADPVRNGFVKTLARPGGNITGLTQIGGDLIGKLLEMLLAMSPKSTRVAYLVNPLNPGHIASLSGIQTAAKSIGVTVQTAHASTPQEIDNAFTTLSRANLRAIIVQGDGYLIQQSSQIAALAAKYRMASIGFGPEFPDAGGLMSYGAILADQFRRAATYVDKILKGAKPADLPVEQPTKFLLVINRKTAKALGLAIPLSLMISVDRVID